MDIKIYVLKTVKKEYCKLNIIYINEINKMNKNKRAGNEMEFP
jgi:hypothetical protein